jgi:uncharacterized membrane protein YgcG
MAKLDQNSTEGRLPVKSSVKLMSLTGICLIALIPSIIAVMVVGGQVGWSFGTSFGCVLLLAATPPVTVWAIRLAEKIVHRQLPRQVALSLLVATFAGVIVAMVLLRGNDDMRCVDTASMTVTSADQCQDNPTGDTTGGFAWYYGGSGLQPGDTATDGSFTAPADQGDDGGGTGGGTGDEGGGADEGGADAGGDGGE